MSAPLLSIRNLRKIRKKFIYPLHQNLQLDFEFAATQ